jgi:hypothetical protein
MSYWKTIAEDKKLVTYRPRLNRLTGKVTATILLQQIMFRWAHVGERPFYKFRAPCKHKLYKEGDSWTEELGFTGSEFDTAIRTIGTKIKRGTSKFEALEGTDVKNLVIYWTDSSRLTWYQLNTPLLETALEWLYGDELLGNSTFLNYLENKESSITKKAKKAALPLSEITTEITTKNDVVVLTKEQQSALDKLLQLGVQPQSTAQRYATSHASDQVIGWCEYALAEGLGAGYVRTMLDAGETAPTVEEKPDHSAHVDYDQVEPLPSPRELTMQQYGIAPEVMDIWDVALGELCLQMAKATFDTWLRGSLLLSVADCAVDGQPSVAQSAVIGVRSAHAVDWLQNRLGKTVQRTLARHLDVEVDRLELVFEVLQKE